ncbi:DUF4350 domain-containing protein [Sabulilitoribacter multivorans]|uniref:DUF4350 domain-containing protein n=1 Tax=Flaviramulus multivorans TaxID=1304750 RepID=A0ABS9IKZ5_9FLAO|nr:DUF4350 domain-containing protein [Flaviramulus multivorans]MCF7561272.1 DUF4350 domain-containing protein [Flaviramulus multivorans]
MKKVLPILIIIVALIVTASLAISIKRTKTVDWEESYDEKSNKPYGVSVFYKELPKLFKDYKVRTVYHQPASYLIANSEDGYGEHVAEGSFIIIGNSDYLEDDSVDELLNFVDAGNTLFISDYSFSQKLHDTLYISTDFIENEKDSISHLSLKYVNIDDILIDRNEGDMYFSSFDSINYSILGYSKIDYLHPNFLQVPFGNGNIYLHLEPKVFTNYNLLKEDRYKYVEGVMSYLPANDVYFDSYTKIQTGYDGDVEKESNLSWFLEQLSFKWAWYTALVFGILFMIFNAKRRQRIIKIIKPLQNTTVAFVKTVSNLYFETQDHKNLIDKKITYFLEKIRNDYNLDTSVLDDVFTEKLTLKTGKKHEDVKKLVDFINWLKSKNEFFEENLVKLNRHIEAFYSK